MWKSVAVAIGIGVFFFAMMGASSTGGVSPAPDMPADWFWHQDKASADKHAALIGKPMPELAVDKWYQGELTSQDLKGKVVIVDLWATWCGPCKAGMPKINDLASKYADKGVVVMAITSSGDDAFTPNFIQEKSLTLPMAWDEGGDMFKALGGQWYPTYVAIDKKGIVRAIGLSPAGVEKAIEKLLAE